MAPPSVDPELDQLSSQECEALRLITRGYTYKELATELAISVKTVVSHVSAVFRKLQLSTATSWPIGPTSVVSSSRSDGSRGASRPEDLGELDGGDVGPA